LAILSYGNTVIPFEVVQVLNWRGYRITKINKIRTNVKVTQENAFWRGLFSSFNAINLIEESHPKDCFSCPSVSKGLYFGIRSRTYLLKFGPSNKKPTHME
jgi:hypothetical protein